MSDITETAILDGTSNFTLGGRTFDWSEAGPYFHAFAGETEGTTTWTVTLEDA